MKSNTQTPLELDEYHLTRVIIIWSITPAEYHPCVYRQGSQLPQTLVGCTASFQGLGPASLRTTLLPLPFFSPVISLCPLHPPQGRRATGRTETTDTLASVIVLQDGAGEDGRGEEEEELENAERRC